ncbi:helix-turn-helix domain-containing protein [Intestinibacillus massiliensis]
MPAQWTAEVIGEMHLNGITAKMLATKIGWHEKYLSAVLNGHREPKGAEVTCKEALQGLISLQDHDNTPDVP